MSKKSSTFAPAFGKTDNPHGPSGRKPAERLRTEERGESVAQQVEHIPFKDGVLGSSPSWFTEREFRLSFLFSPPSFFPFLFPSLFLHSHSPFSFFQIMPCNFACKITTKNPNTQDFFQNNRLNVVK